jgi:hypothetical protein
MYMVHDGSDPIAAEDPCHTHTREHSNGYTTREETQQ